MSTPAPSASSPRQIAITRSTDADQAEYVRFLDGFAANPGAALGYHYPFYLRLLSEHVYRAATPRVLLARDPAGAIAGAMPAVHLRAPDFSVWVSLPYFGPNAGAIVPNAGTPEGDAIVEALLAAAVDDARACGADSMTVYTPLAAPPDAYRAALGDPDFEVGRVSQCLPLPADPNESPWPRKVRYDIRRAASLGVTARPIANDAELDCVWNIYEQHSLSAGIPVKPRSYISRMYHTADANALFLAAEHDGRIIGGLICLMGGGVLSYYLPCMLTEARPLQPGLLLLDRAVAMARSAGCRLLNFEASVKVEDSVYKFKARCGGTPVSYRVFVKMIAPGALDRYRALGPRRLSEQLTQAFVVPFSALTAPVSELT
jgi:hypothetical protein